MSVKLINDVLAGNYMKWMNEYVYVVFIKF